MPDREKVIKGLDALLKAMHENQCYTCSHEFVEVAQEFGTNVIEDTIILLKGQKAVEPTLRRKGWNKYYNYYVCPRCHNEVEYEQNYCSECGMPFLWKGGEVNE